MIKIVAICGNGLGSSLIIQMAIEDVVNELNIDAEVSHLNLSSYTPENNFDIIICGQDLSDYIEVTNTHKIALQNILDKNQIKEELKNFLKL